MFNTQFLGREIKRIITDSRSARPGDLFVAYKGEKADGNDYVDAALQAGASAALAERYSGSADNVFIASDVQSELEKIVTEFRSKLSIPVIGITGSVGKTTAKEMISCVLSEKYAVHKTEGNFNNEIGVPLTLGGIMPEHEIAVAELGISHPGDMQQLAKMAMPTHMVYTVIGNAHLEFLTDREGVYNAKVGELLSVCNPVIFANGEDDYLSRIKNAKFYGSKPICEPPAYGRHIISAMCAAELVGREFGLSDDEIIRGIGKFKVIGRRGTVSKGFATVIDDSYNANSDSMISAVDSMLELPGQRHICVFGSILELGSSTIEQQHMVADYAKSKGCIVLQSKADYGCDEYDISKIQEGDVVLVKASRGARLDIIADELKAL